MTAPMPDADPHAAHGLRFMVLGALFFSLMSLLVKLAGRTLPTMELVFARAVVVTGLSGLVMTWRRTPLGRPEWGLLGLRGLFGLVALSLFYYSVVRLPLAEATLIHFTNPVFTAFTAALFLAERLVLRQILLALVSLAGVAVIVRPLALLRGEIGTLDPFAVAAGLGAAVFAAGAYTLVRRLRHHDAMLVIFSFASVSLVGTLPLVPTFRMPSEGEWFLLAGVGASTFLGQLFLTLGLQREPAGRATAVGYLQIVFASFWGLTVFGDRPGIATVIGAVIIVGSSVALAGRRERRGPDSAAG